MRALILNVSVVLALVVPISLVAQPDIFYFHDSGNNGIWDNQWNPAVQNCSLAGEYMDCNFPTGAVCLTTPVFGGWAGGPLCWLDLPGCQAANYPAGNWVANLWLTASAADIIVVQLWIVECDSICNAIWWSGPVQAAFGPEDVCTQLSITIAAPAIALTDTTRLALEIYSTNWGSMGQQTTWLCWNANGCQSNLVAPACVFCGASSAETSSWGTIKSLYR